MIHGLEALLSGLKAHSTDTELELHATPLADALTALREIYPSERLLVDLFHLAGSFRSMELCSVSVKWSSSSACQGQRNHV